MGKPIPGELGKFEVADAPRALLPEEKIWPAIAAWTKWSGAHRSCDVCGRLVLQMGMERAPRVQPARYLRKGPNNELFVCSGHALVLRPEDERVEREAAERRELTAQMQTRRAAAKASRPTRRPRRSELAS